MSSDIPQQKQKKKKKKEGNNSNNIVSLSFHDVYGRAEEGETKFKC